MAENEKSKTWQFDDLLAARRAKPDPAPKPAKAAPLPAEPVDPERAGAQVGPVEDPKAGGDGRTGRPSKAGKAAKVGKPKPAAKAAKPKRRVGDYEMRRHGMRRRDPVEVAVLSIVAPANANRSAGRTGNRPGKPGYQQHDQLADAMLAYAPHRPWMSWREIRRAVEAAQIEWPDHQTRQAVDTAVKHSLLETRAVLDPRAENFELAPGDVVPRRLWRVTRAGEALRAVIG